LPDALGSVRQLANGNGAVVLAQSYKPYGEVLNSAGAGTTPYGYTGEWTDGSGLVFLRARYLDPGTGRFLTRDPWGGSVMRPGTFNGYSYVTNNPVRLVDPLGLCEVDPYDPYYDYDCWIKAAKVAEILGDTWANVGLGNDEKWLDDFLMNIEPAYYNRWLYKGWKVGMFYCSAPLLGEPLCHGRRDVTRYANTIKQYAEIFYELIVAASIAHQASDFLEMPFGCSLPNEVLRSFEPWKEMSVGIAQITPMEMGQIPWSNGQLEAQWAPLLYQLDPADPEVAIQIMVAKVEAADNYILYHHPELENGIGVTDRYMLLAIAQNSRTRSGQAGAIDAFFEAGMDWYDMFSDRPGASDNWREQLRLVYLHVEWLIGQGWEPPEGLDLDYWRQRAFSVSVP